MASTIESDVGHILVFGI